MRSRWFFQHYFTLSLFLIHNYKMGLDSDAPRYIEIIDLPNLSSAFYCFQRDFDVSEKLLIDLERTEIQSRIQNYYDSHGISTPKNALTTHAILFDLVFKVMVGEMLLKKIESHYKNTNKFTKQMVLEITSYNRLRAGYNKYNKELHKHMRDYSYFLK